MERKITHYVVKPEHREHLRMILGLKQLCTDSVVLETEIKLLTEAKVLDLWCTPVYEKPRVKGWYNVRETGTLLGPYNSKEESYWTEERMIIGKIFIDQEIE